MTPGAFCQKRFLDILKIFCLDASQINSKKAFAPRFRKVLGHFCSGMRRNKILNVTFVFRLFSFLIVFAFRFSLFLIFLLQWLTCYWACLQLLKSFPCQKTSLRRAIFPLSTESSVVAGNFVPRFSLQFLSIFGHILCFTKPITLIWVSLERSFPPAELEYR